MSIESFKDLYAWQRAHEVVLCTYTSTEALPKHELFGLTSQMRRAAISAESNIAEGFGRTSAKDKQHFYAMARGSLYELQSQTITAGDLGYLSKNQCTELERRVIEAQ